MALIDIQRKYSNILDNIELKEEKNKNDDDIINKAIKFNKDERIYLKFIAYINQNFGTYIKQLIEKDIENVLGNKIEKNIDEEYLISLIEKVINKKNKANEVDKVDKEMLDDLSALGIQKR